MKNRMSLLLLQFFLFCFVLSCFGIEPYSITQAGLELTMILPFQLPKSWDYSICCIPGYILYWEYVKTA